MENVSNPIPVAMAFLNSGCHIYHSANMVVRPGLKVKFWGIHITTRVMSVYDKSWRRR